jgi:signal transduction histidine kinase
MGRSLQADPSRAVAPDRLPSPMTRPDPAPPTAPAATAAEAWLGVSDELLSAINHALSNRLAALISLARVLEYGDAAGNPLLPMLQQEVERLEQTTSLLRLLPREAHDQPEPVRLADVLPNVLALHRLRSDARDLKLDVRTASDPAPAWVSPGLLSHALLMLLDTATRAALRAAAASVAVSCYGGDEFVGVVVELPAQANLAAQETTLLASIGEMLRQAGGELVADSPDAGAGPARIEVRLPTLAAVRKRETRTP